MAVWTALITCFVAAVILLAGYWAVREMPVEAWEQEVGNFKRRHEYRQNAQKTKADLERKNQGLPFPRWPKPDQARYVAAETILKELE